MLAGVFAVMNENAYFCHMKTLLLGLFIISVFSVRAQNTYMEDSTRLRALYGESETFDAALNQLSVVGTDAPFITAMSPEGEEIYSDMLSDKVILVHFWFLTCGGCIKENAVMNRLADTLKNHLHFRLLAFANNSDEELRHFLIRDSLYFGSTWKTIQHHPDLRFNIFADPDEKVFNQFKEWAYPSSILIDRDGIIRKIIHRHELEMTDDEFFIYLLSEIQRWL